MSAEDFARRNEGAKALVTGGGQGIGFAIARRLVEEGCCKLVLVGRSEEKGKRYHDHIVGRLAELVEWLRGYRGPIGRKAGD